MSFKETGFWKAVHISIVSLLFLCGGTLLYTLSRSRSLTSKRLKEIRKIFDSQKKWIEESKDKLNEIPEMWQALTKANKEFKDMNKRLSDLLNKTGKDVDKLIKAKEEFEKEKSEYKDQ